MFSDDQDLYSNLLYYQDDTHGPIKTHTELHAADPNFGFSGDVLKISMEDELGFSQDTFSPDSLLHTTTGGLGATGFDGGPTTTDIRDLVDPLLPREESFPLLDSDFSASLDLATIQLDSMDVAGFDDNLFGLEDNSSSSESGLLVTGPYNSLQNNYLPVVDQGRETRARSTLGKQEESPRRQRPTRSKRAAAVAAAATLSRVIHESIEPELDNQYPTLSDLRVTVEEDAPRKRQARVSYSTLTEDERYQRIRELNNVASRHYREKKVKHVGQQQQQEVQESLRNKKLQKKVEGLQRLRDEMERYTQNFMRQHMGGSM
ncbi:hypothetical protein Pmani_014807 [Petrolisthes manimaculis]|uniref:BZIP domain-containing protein n=1 Tax=Petrolisthes manimaculis TaxID=1843537 RepID=A0AAE1PSV6_9EUCA|nr:hypothetical protein Pmani_014807 [Petrolisthes manimaculis]